MQIHDAITNIFASKLRSFLALLGILIGTAAVVAMVSGGEMATQQALAQFKKLGTNLLSVSIGGNEGDKKGDALKKQKLDLNAAINVKNISENIELVAPYTNLYFPIYFKGKLFQGSLIGATDEFKTVNQIDLLQGRFVSVLDKHENYCVMGYELYKKMRELSPEILGQQIKVGDEFFTVVGILKTADDNSFIYTDINNSIFIPIQTSLSLRQYAEINSIILRVKEDTNITVLENQMTNYINNNISGKQLYFRDPKQFIQQMEKQREILTVFLGFIGGISLLVGGIGIMNIMLASVIERRREIGIRLAIGARRRDIQSLFLVESIILSLLGGVCGVILGILISLAIAIVKHWGFVLFIIPPLIGFSVSVLIGIFFGFYPAYKASKLNPIETLHAE
jgi:putative ABC transport system permease protein